MLYFNMILKFIDAEGEPKGVFAEFYKYCYCFATGNDVLM